MKNNSKTPEIHIGNIVKQYIDDNRIYKSSLARKLEVNDAVILSYQKRSNLTTNTLTRLSHALKHNFFADIAALLPAEYSKNIPFDTSKDLKIAQLEEDLKMARAEVEVLIKVIAAQPPKGA